MEMLIAREDPDASPGRYSPPMGGRQESGARGSLRRMQPIVREQLPQVAQVVG